MSDSDDGTDGSSSDDDDDDGDGDENGVSQAWKSGMAMKAAERFLRRKSQTVNLQDLVYGDSAAGSTAKVSEQGNGCNVFATDG